MSVRKEYYQLLSNQKQFAFSVKRPLQDFTFSFKDFKEYREDRTTHYFNADLKLVKSRSIGQRHEDCDEPECGDGWFCDLCTDLNPVSDESADGSDLYGSGELVMHPVHVLECDLPVSPLLEQDRGELLCPEYDTKLVGDSQHCEPVLPSELGENSLCLDAAVCPEYDSNIGGEAVYSDCTPLIVESQAIQCQDSPSPLYVEAQSCTVSERFEESGGVITIEDCKAVSVPDPSCSAGITTEDCGSFPLGISEVTYLRPFGDRSLLYNSHLGFFNIILLLNVYSMFPTLLAIEWALVLTSLLNSSPCQNLVFDRGKAWSCVSGKGSHHLYC